jgi:zinc protease
VRDAARKWLTDDVYILEIEPYPEYGTTASSADRSKLPNPGDAPEIKFPALQRAALPNGLKVVLAERHATPLVNVILQIDAGFASDQFAIPGTARLATDMLDEGTTRRTALDISKELGLLGAELSTDADLDSSNVRLSSLTSALDRSLEIFADVVLNPSFPQDDFARLQKQRIAGIKQEKVEPADMALRVFPALLYGRGHAYGNPLTGSGTEESVAKLTRADAQKFHQTWFKPNNSTLIVVGDTTLQEMMPKLEKLLGKWRRGDVPRKNLAAVEHRKKTSVYLIDRPGSIQSVILAGHIAPPRSNPDEIAIETMNTVLGGAFTARVNMNLREGKHWSYGAWTFMYGARGQRPFIAYAPVQTDKTRESLVELNKEFRGVRGEQPITRDELKKAQDFQTRALPGSWETISAVAGSIGEIVRFDLPDDYYATYPKKVHSLAISDLARAANDVVRPDNLVWVIVGDRAKIEAGIRDLGWADIQLLDADGNQVTAAEQLRR